jgi:hypothetical protein
MKGGRHTPEQIARGIREADRLLSRGQERGRSGQGAAAVEGRERQAQAHGCGLVARQPDVEGGARGNF